MDVQTVKKYQPYVNLVTQLDTLRAGRFVNPNELKKNTEIPELGNILREKIKNWDALLEIFHKTFANKLTWVNFVESLRWIEVPTLTAYLCVVAMALFKNAAWAERISLPITLVAFIYLAITRVSITILVDNQAKKLQKQLIAANPSYRDKLHKAANATIEALDNILLDMGEGGSDFRLKLRETDYAGVTYILKPSKIGPEVLDAFPFPFHCKLSKAKSFVHILMSRRDDKLIQALAEVPKYTEIQMIVTHPVADQKSFPKFTDALKKMHSRFRMVIVNFNEGEKDTGVQVLFEDSIWKLDMRPTSGYLRLPYLPVDDEDEKASYEALFKASWSENQSLA